MPTESRKRKELAEQEAQKTVAVADLADDLPEIEGLDKRYPLVQDVVHKPLPGITYAYVLGSNIEKAKELGFNLSNRGETFTVGDYSVVIMQKGVPVSAVGGSTPILVVDVDLDELLRRESEVEPVQHSYIEVPDGDPAGAEALILNL